jgi:hypothetical protein
MLSLTPGAYIFGPLLIARLAYALLLQVVSHRSNETIFPLLARRRGLRGLRVSRSGCITHKSRLAQWGRVGVCSRIPGRAVPARGSIGSLAIRNNRRVIARSSRYRALRQRGGGGCYNRWCFVGRWLLFGGRLLWLALGLRTFRQRQILRRWAGRCTGRE